MKFKIDENLPDDLVEVFEQYGHDADTVVQEGLAGSSDEVVWPAAVSAERALVTGDLDFSDIRKFEPGTHPGIILFRERTAGLAAILRRFNEVLAAHDANDWARCFVVISATKIRIRRRIEDDDQQE